MKYGVVTGSTKGIGKEIGKALLKAGYRVIFNYARDEEGAALLQRELDVFEGMVWILKQKLENKRDVEDFYESCKKITNSIDVLVLNAGCTDRTSWEELTWEQWGRVMDINLNVPAALVRRFTHNLRDNGNIVFVGAGMGKHAHAISVPYTVSKAGIHGLTKALVKEYCQRGIRVNAVLPGFVETPWQKDKPLEQRERICEKIALHRFAEPEEIAELVLGGIINASYVNGALIEADGGYCYK